jgi:tRNA (cytidine/uridine-2'-O-)-methyltransferase
VNNVVLVHPQIGGNTGAIIRLASNLGFTLHLVEPFGFEITDSRVKRAGLDYRELADVRQHPDWAAAAQATTGSRRLAFTAHADLHLHEVSIDPADVLVFGCETSGLPAEILVECVPVRIPMMPGNRSINLANAVAIAAYEAWRQQGFVGATARVTNQPVPAESFTPFDSQARQNEE